MTLQAARLPKYVSTRYQGSKRKIVTWIIEKLRPLKYKSVLDGFSGTSSVAYEFKKLGKHVICNDILKFNYIIALALIENSQERLDEKEIKFILEEHDGTSYQKFIQNTFSGIYYENQENSWLDVVCQNIQGIENLYKKAIALFALFQSCLVKRPFNIFHRKNLYLRSNDVKRTFHNHKTWERPFDVYFKRFVKEANACVFSNGFPNEAWNMDIFDIEETGFDLVYLDPPYIPSKNRGIDYHHYYHFLEGLCDYENWHTKIDFNSKHLRLLRIENVWTKKTVVKAFEDLMKKFQESIIVISYRSPGFPSKSLLVKLLESYKKKVRLHERPRQYALSKQTNNQEILLIGE